jgi:hypothetical protein
MDDLRYEYWGMMLTDWLVGILKSEFHPAAPDISGRTRELAAFLPDRALTLMPDWCPQEMKAFMRWTGDNLSAWVTACGSLM